MNKKTLYTLVTLIFAVQLFSGCSNQSNQESDKAVEYKRCLEDETGKLLDETASNFEYARGEATKICAPLDSTATP
jgi:ABC-type Fe3+-citrate transport system substrate-binding protein